MLTESRHVSRPSIETMEDRFMLSTGAVAISPTAIHLTWNNIPSTNNVVVREVIHNKLVRIATLPVGTIAYDVKNLKPNTTYKFDIGVLNGRHVSSIIKFNAHTTKKVTLPKTNQIQPPVISITHAPVTVAKPISAAGTTYQITTGTLFGPNGPSPFDVRQGNLGDCWLLSALTEVAARSPNTIRNMFTYIGQDATNNPIYSVTLHDWLSVPHSVIVDTYLPNGGTYYATPVNGVYWVALVEKAYIEANSLGYVRTDYPGVNNYDALNSGDAAWATAAITGYSAGDLMYAYAGHTIDYYLNRGDYISVLSITPNDPKISANHWYAAVNATATTVTIMNPWGVNDLANPTWVNADTMKYYGVITVDNSFITNNFTYMTITAH